MPAGLIDSGAYLYTQENPSLYGGIFFYLNEWIQLYLLDKIFMMPDIDDLYRFSYHSTWSSACAVILKETVWIPPY